VSTSLDGIALRGAEAARIVLLEFGDFECPFCGKYARETFGLIDTEFVQTGKVKYGFRHFPLEGLHRHAMSASQAAACAGRQQRFWQVREFLYGHQDSLMTLGWPAHATTLGLDLKTFEECIGEGDDSEIRADVAEGKRLGVSSTPTFFVGESQPDGHIRLLRRIRGAQPYGTFKDAMNQVHMALMDANGQSGHN
jgi:protein-disulfide isomerase